MWLITPVGFFSIVQKAGDIERDTLTVCARVRRDLVDLRDHFLPGLGEIEESDGTDYRFRAVAPREDVSVAMARMVNSINYSDFKSEVASVHGIQRASLYHEVWSVLYKLQTIAKRWGKSDSDQAAPVAAVPMGAIADFIRNTDDGRVANAADATPTAVRAEYWPNLKDMPEEHAVLSHSLSFTAQEMMMIRRGFSPKSMDDKWFVYFSGDRLRMHRSWTGVLIYEVVFGFYPDGAAHITHVLVNRKRTEYYCNDDSEDMKLMEQVIRYFLINTVVMAN